MQLRKYIFWALLGSFLAAVFMGNAGGEKRTKGIIRLNAGIFDQVKGEQACRVDSAVGFVIELAKEVENPLFESEARNRVNLLLWFKGSPETGKRYYVPGNDFLGLCYREEGDLLMFETFSGIGWIEFRPSRKKGKMEGVMEMRLVEPHHNFSNSDFHYWGGEIVMDLFE